MDTLMGLITERELKEYKKSDIVIIWGCGSSIKKITDLEYYNLSQFDSIAFNFFCFSDIPVTYYLVREQANLKKRTNGEENIDNFYQYMNTSYKDSCLIVHDLSDHSSQVYNYSSEEGLFKFNNKYIIVKDKKLKNNSPGVELWKNINIFEEGICHGKCSLTNAIHFALYMKYNKIIFVGIDLYDSRYFWLNDDETRYSVINKKKNKTSQHSTSKDVISLVKDVKKHYPKVKMYSYNPQSLLSNIIEVWK